MRPLIAPHIVGDPPVRFGTPVIEGTRGPVDPVLGTQAGGMTAEELAQGYCMAVADVRAVLRAELDAYYAHLYGLTDEELRYILDPADVYGPDFPGETFRVLKEKEIRRYGEYRTRRLVLAAWDRLSTRIAL